MVDISNASAARPIASKDSAETFLENDVTVSSSGAVAFDGSITIGESSTANLPSFDETSTSSDGKGMAFIPNSDLVRLRVKLNEDNGEVQTVFLTDDTGDNIIAEDTTGHSGGDIVSLEANLQEGNTYIIGVYDEGSTFTYASTPSADYPISSTHLTVTTGYEYYKETPYNPTDPAVVFDYIEGTTLAGTSGSATIEWPYPDDIFRWDAITFQESDDGENVGVYVEESTDGGSTWFEIQGPISRGDQINADPGSRVRFRVELSRSDTSNNPTLDAIYRRWVL